MEPPSLQPAFERLFQSHMEKQQHAVGDTSRLEPFELPSEDEWAALRLAEAGERQARRARHAALPIHAKSTMASRMQALVDPDTGPSSLRVLLQGGASGNGAVAAEGGGGGGSASGVIAATLPADLYMRRTGDSVRDMLAKKRQIFLVQMSLDNKRKEIAKLEQRARQREEALRASEAALDADAKRFDEFLKENDARLQEALCRAETEARARQDKGTEAKRLAAANTRARADLAKAEEALGEARRCAEFLDRVTPEAHFAALVAEREAAKEALRAEWRADCEALARRRAEAAAAKAAAERDMQWARTQQQYERAEVAARTAAAALREAAAAPEPPPPDLAAVDAQEAPLFFEDPTQLLAVFSQLEGRNLFLIQASGASWRTCDRATQDAEAALEVARAERSAIEAALGEEAAGLRRQVEVMVDAIVAARSRCQHLRTQAEADLGKDGSRCDAESGGGSTSSAPAPGGAGNASSTAASGVDPPLLGQLTQAYAAAGFSADASLTPLAMLAQLEAHLEDCIAAVEAGVPAAVVEAVEKARERERRQAARQGKLAAQEAEHEARVQRVLERAAAPAFKRSGRTKMVRSMLAPRRQAKVGSKEADDAERELQAYLSLGANEGADGSRGMLALALEPDPNTAAEGNGGS